MTVRRYVVRWLQLKTAQKLRAGTIEHYLDVLGRRLTPAVIVVDGRGVCFGDLPIAGVDRQHVAGWIVWAAAQRSREGQAYADKTLDGWWRVVRPFLRDAAADYRRPDPTDRLRGPRSDVRGVREGRTLSAAQLARLLEVVRRSYPSRADEIETIALTGMRPGELYALRWADVDDQTGVIQVSKSVRRGVASETKTSEPRTVALSAGLAKLLAKRRWRAEDPSSGALVFPATNGGYRGAQTLTKPIRLARIEAGIPFAVGPQVLRRTFNTLNAERGGVADVVLRAQMGHSSAAMTRRYAGVHVEAQRAMVDALEGDLE